MSGLRLLSALVLAAACGSSDPVTSSGGSGADGGGGTGMGSGSGTGSGSDGGTGLCQVIQVDSTRVRPEMLIVLDRSSSMLNLLNGVDRWTPSVAGIKAITTNLDTRVDFGLMAFPGAQACAPGTVQVPIEPMAAADISASLDGLELIQSTPTAQTLEAARAAVAQGSADPEARGVGGTYIVLVTDGAPNCSDGQTGGGGGPDPVAVESTVAAISALAGDGVKTYVLAFGAANDAALATALDRMAVAGATGDTAHRPIENQNQIETEFGRIAGAALTCDLSLDAAVEDASYVAVTIDGNLVGLNDANGWVLSADRTRITLQGSSCAMLKDTTTNHAVKVEVRCTKVYLG
jgi:von Willebrand factor type A domain